MCPKTKSQFARNTENTQSIKILKENLANLFLSKFQSMNKTDDHTNKHKFKKPTFQFLKNKPLSMTKSSTTSAIAPPSPLGQVHAVSESSPAIASHRLSLQNAFNSQLNMFNNKKSAINKNIDPFKYNNRRLSDYQRPSKVRLLFQLRKKNTSHGTWYSIDHCYIAQLLKNCLFFRNHCDSC